MARPRGRGLEKARLQQAQEKAASRKARSRGRTVAFGVGAVAVVAAVVAWVISRPPPPGEEYESLGNLHLATLDQPHFAYNSRPPSSGPHLGALADWAEASQELPPELWVHNLEDGGIVLAYSCGDECPELRDRLRTVLADFAGRRVLLIPYSDIVDRAGVEHKAAAVAWTRVYYFDELTEETRGDLDTFIRLYEGVDHHAGR